MSMDERADDRDFLAPLDDEDTRLERIRPIPRVSIQAFCESDAVASIIERAGADRRMAKAHLRVHKGGLAAAVEHFANAPTPNLVILETRHSPGELMGELEALAEVCDPGSKVVVIGHYNDVALYRDLMRQGLSEYLVAPISIGEIMDVLSTIFVSDEAEPLGRTVAFVAAKGGVGSSTVAHNVAWLIGQLFETDTLLIDLDLPFGTTNIDFDFDPAQGVAEAVASGGNLDENFLDKLLVRCDDHLSLLTAPSALDDTYDHDGAAFDTLIETAQSGAPVVVLDVPHIWSAWTRNVLRAADRVVVTASPDLANLRNAKNLIDVITKLRPNDPPPLLVLNQIGMGKRPEIEVAEFAEPLGLSPVATIGFDPLAFGNAANNGKVLSESEPKHEAAEAFRRIAHAVTGRSVAKARPRSGLLELLRLKRSA